MPKLSATPEADRLATVIDGLQACIVDAQNKSTIVQQKDGTGGTVSVDKPTPDYAVVFKCWIAIGQLWGLAGGSGKGGKSTNAQGEDSDPEDLAAGGESLFGNGH